MEQCNGLGLFKNQDKTHSSMCCAPPLLISLLCQTQNILLMQFLFVGFLGWIHSLAIINTVTINIDVKLAL